MKGAQRRPSWRMWRAALITPMTEFRQLDHVLTMLGMAGSQLLLTWWLWRALYAGQGPVAGLAASQAATYALLGVLYMRFRIVDRWANGDQMVQLVQHGTIAYWFLRPVTPARYYLIRTAGDLAYGGVWAGAGYAVCLVAGLITPPASLAAGLAAAATTAVGLVIVYYLQLLVDLLCFWTVVNSNALVAMQFAQNLLSGAFAPLWFFPGWFQRADGWLPFSGTLNVPLSLYVGRLAISSAGHELVVQVAWAAALALAARLVWRRAAARVTVLGG